MAKNGAVTLKGVTKRFDAVLAVNNLSLRINEGSVFGLLGPNGAGKTTTLRMILRIMVPDEGAIEMLGEPLTESAQDRIGYLPEERGLYTRMRVRDVLLFLAGLKGLGEREAGRRVDEWLERLDLRSWTSNKVIDLSKGMQQKVQFIAAVVHRPPVLILDEPFTGLDPVNAGIIKDIMLDLRKQGSTIILSTHRMEQVEMMCDSICLINRGQSVLDGELAAIKRSYGKNTVRLEYEGDPGFLDQPDLVAAINHFGAVTEVRLRPNGDPQEILKAAVARGVRINRFELVEPPLNDIFIEKVAGTAHA
ncbi:MAG TPA: ATP-binding cassette domain-containing protein [Terriglobia bacterium]|nr:ATP-binding cassette domain-containing protein [Terriglobia bacterium]